MPKKLLPALEHGFVIFALVYSMGSLSFLGGIRSSDNPALQAVGPDAPESPLLSLIQLGILAGTFVFAGIHRDRILYLITKRKVLWLFLGLIFVSFLWSEIPDTTLRRAIIYVSTALLGLGISARYTLREQLYLFAWVAGLIVTINILFTLALPSAGFESGEHAGAFRGVYPQKNTSSRMFVFSSMVLLLATMGAKHYRTLLSVLLGLSVLLTILTASKGALIILLILFAFVPLLQILRLKHGLALPASMLALLMGASTLVFFVANTEILVSFLGRDLTLTGRTGIWSAMLSKIATRPWLGYGYKGFWRGLEGDSIDIWYETLFVAPNGHNGFLDITITLGIVGLVLFLLTFVVNYLRSLTWLRLQPAAEGLLPVMYLTFLLLYNLAESTIFDATNWVIALYTCITTTVLIQPILVADSSPVVETPAGRMIEHGS